MVLLLYMEKEKVALIAHLALGATIIERYK